MTTNVWAGRAGALSAVPSADDAQRSAASTTVLLAGVLLLGAVAASAPAVVASSEPLAAGTGIASTVVAGALLCSGSEWFSRGPGRALAALACPLVVAVLLASSSGLGLLFFYNCLAAAAVAAALFGTPGVGISSAIGLAAAVAASRVPSAILPAEPDAALLAGLPVPFLLAGVLFAVVRHIHAEQVGLRSRLAEATHAAGRAQERLRLGHDLHDSLAKTVAGIGLFARALEGRAPDEASRSLSGRIVAAADRAAVDARLLVLGLREGNDADTPEPAVRAVCRAWSREHCIPVHVRVHALTPAGGATPPQAPDDTDPTAVHVLVSVLRELLDNAARHAAPRTVDVLLGLEEASLSLEVADDGNGFAVPEDLASFGATAHYGLLGCEERLNGVGGTMRARSCVGRGTTVAVTIPRRPAHAEPRPWPVEEV